MEIVPSKAAMTLTSANWRWVHEEAWEDYHRVFASDCACFLPVGPQRCSWLSRGGQGLPPDLNCGYKRAGRWLLEIPDTKTLSMAALLQWEEGSFCSGWISISNFLSQETYDSSSHPLNWLVDALFCRLSPDVMTLSGELPHHFISAFELTKTLVPCGSGKLNSSHALMRIDADAWQSWPEANSAKQELSWVRRRVDRERKEEERILTPRRRPFLIRLLTAMSPIRRMKHEKMIHPLTRYRSRSIDR